MKNKQSRRIKKELKDFFDKQNLTDYEKSFILGCIKAQSQFPQLTTRQWEQVIKIKERYTNGKVSGGEEAS
jgi:hypothetical protein